MEGGVVGHFRLPHDDRGGWHLNDAQRLSGGLRKPALLGSTEQALAEAGRGGWHSETRGRCRFDDAIFTHSRHGASRFEECSFVNADFSAARWTGAHFEGCDFSGAVLSEAAIRGCTFVRCAFSGARGEPELGRGQHLRSQ